MSNSFIKQYEAKERRLNAYMQLLRVCEPDNIARRMLLGEWIENLRDWLEANKEKYEGIKDALRQLKQFTD